jgi:hypothetical protein
VEVADWAPTPSLVGTMLLSLLTALVLSRIRFWAAFLLPLGILIGIGVIIWFMTAAAPAALKIETSGQLFERLGMWLFAARNDGISVDPLPFAVGMMIAAWVSGFLGGWVFFRYRTFWGVFALGTVGLLSNLTFLPENASVYLAMYLFTGLLLVGWVQSVRARQRWDREGRIYDGHLGILTMSDTALVALVALLIAFLLPIGGQWGPANAFYSVTRTPLVTWEEDFNRLFAGLPARRALPYRIWGDSVAFQGTINPTTTPVLQVNSPVPMYWKARSYGTYTPKGWVSSGTVFKTTDWSPEYSIPAPYRQRFGVTYAVTPRYDSRNLFAGGQILGVDRDVRVETYDSPLYRLDLTGASARSLGHPTLAEARANLQGAVGQRGGAVTDAALAQELPRGLELADVEREGAIIRSVTVAEILPEQPDTLSVRAATGTVEPGETYQVTASVSLATPERLRLASREYPIWAVDKYTQLPDDLPPRIARLAAEITAGHETPYDKAKAVETYLKNNITYNLQIDPPPFNADGVDYFLFDQQEGYSEYFGSAMTVLLRTQDIPARLVTGYTVGNKVPEHDIFVVSDSHSHAWSEVYFPSYGWIPFEPTPGATFPVAAIPKPKEETADLVGELQIFDELCEDDEDECDPSASTPQGQGGDAGEGALTYGKLLARFFPWIAGAAVFLVLLAALGRFFWRRYMATTEQPEDAFRRLGFLGRLNSLGVIEHQTPFQYGARLQEAFPDQRGDLATIIQSYVRSLYGKKELTGDEQEGLVRAWQGVRFPLLLHVLRRRTNESS